MIGRRAFASKLIRDSNVDVRHKLAKILASASSSPVLNNENCLQTSPDIPPPVLSPGGSVAASTTDGHCGASGPDESGYLNNYYCDTPINDLVDPVDFEDFIISNSARIPAYLRPVLIFPLDDIVVEKYEPPLRTLESAASPEFNNIQTSEDPYIQSVGGIGHKSLLVIKKYEKYPSVVGLHTERLALVKELKRQEFECDLAVSDSNECALFDSVSDTPNTFYSRRTSLKNTPRPQSLISNTSNSTVRPPLASDEDDFTDEDDDNDDDEDDIAGAKTPLAIDDCDNIPPIDSREDELDSNNRNSWIYTEPICSLDQLATFGSKTKSLFSLQNSQSDPHIQGILQRDHYGTFFDNLPIYYSNSSISGSCDGNNFSNDVPIFCMYPLQYDNEQIESRPMVPPPADVPRYRLLVKCLTLKMDLSVEPIFASIAIYDAKEKRKVTENFFFDLNSDGLKRLLRTHVSYQDVSTLARNAIFPLSQLSPDMFFVIKLEKVFQGDSNDFLEAYTKPPEDPSKIEKMKIISASNCERLGRYRMPFAWAAFPLVDILTSGQSSTPPAVVESGDAIRNNSSSLDSLKRIANECTPNFVRKGSLERHSTLSSAISNFSAGSVSSANSASSTLDRRMSSMCADDLVVAYQNFKPVTITSKVFYRYDGDRFADEDLYRLLQEFKRQGPNSKRFRSMPCTLKLDIQPVPDETQIKCRINPELVPLHPYSDDRAPLVKEVLEFRELRMPHIEHRNLLYVYIKSLNFANRQGSARNLSIKLQLLSSEEKFSALPVIFGKSSSPEMLSEAYTALSYHNRCPNFSEEFKIRLPCKLNKQTHLLFTVVHVHTKPKNDVPVDEVVGYTWLPLWREDCLQTGTFSLPVLAEPPTAGYSFLHPSSIDQLPNVKWIDCHKPLLVVQLDSYSSIFAQDSHVDRFFRITSSLEQQVQMSSYLHSSNLYEEFARAITGLAHSNIDSLVKFVHLILNRLLVLLVRPPQIFSNHVKSKQSNSIKSFQTLIFESAIMIVSKINAALYGDYLSMRSGILSTFVMYQAVFPQPEQGITYLSNEFRNSKSGVTVEDAGGELFVPRLLHEELLHQWLVSSESILDKLWENAFFWFDLIFKSLCVHLSLNNAFMLPPRKRLSKACLHLLEELTRIIGEFVYAEQKRNTNHDSSNPCSPQSPSCQTPYLLQHLNHSFAFFIRDLLSVLDRNFVYNRLIKSYMRKLCNSPLPSSGSCNSFASTSYSTNTDGTSVATTSTKLFADSLFELRVDFLRVLSGHEHFVPLNLPFGTPLFTALEQSAESNNNLSFSPSSSLAKAMLNSSIFSRSLFDCVRPYAELTDDYRRQHWPLGLIFCTLVESFTRTKTHLQLRAANLIRSMLTSYDWDLRYKDAEIKSRIACLFFPLIGLLIDVLAHLHDPSTNKENPFYSAEENRKYQRSKSYVKDSTGSLIDSNIAMAIAGSVMNGAVSPDLVESGAQHSKSSLPSSPQHGRHLLVYQPISEETTRTLLACFLWILGNADQRLLRRILTEFSNERLLTFLELLRLSLRIFEYEGERSFRKNSRFQLRRQSFQKLEDVIRFGTARRELMRRRDFSQSFGSSDNGDMKFRWKKDSTLSRYSSLPHAVTKGEVQEEIVLEGNLCTVSNLIIIDSFSLTLSILRERIHRHQLSPSMMRSHLHTPAVNYNLKNKYASDEFVLGSALHLLMQLLSMNQSTYVLEAAFHCQRALLHHFPDLLFIEGLPDVEFCSELCYLLLKHCASQIEIVRAQASASMYLLMRQHSQSTSNFSRIKIQITMSLSQLVGTSRSFNELYIRRSLKSILKYAISDTTVQDTNFPKQVHELIFNLHMILSDTMQMKEHEQDPEMLLDLMYRVAKGYQNSPELRLTWLQNMAQKHAELSQHVEAAQCYVHAGALVAECLHKISRRTYLPISCAAFQRVCPNVFEESLNSNAEITIDKSSVHSDDSTLDSKRGVRSAKLFSETGFVSLMEQAAHYFHVGSMFEAVNEVYKLLIPIHEAHHRYKELAKVHGRLQDVFFKIDSNEGKRVFATYFRVGFYGSLFGDLDQEEFVYKEPFLTKLPEVSNRLETFYANRFGIENVEVIKDSNPVDTTKLKPNKAYIQITYVEPYFDSWELKIRHTCFERNYNVKRFIYSTPFTLDGRAHGALYEQCKRKTILTTVQALPYVKTRVQVQDRHQMVLSPIEVAIEDVQKKTTELSVATHQEPVDPKILQMVLQGCVGTTVNQGPAEIAFVFLSEEPAMPANCQRPPPAHQQKLRIAFKDFCFKCGEALTKNRQLVSGHEQQVEYHKELERNFYRFTERLGPLMGNPNTKQAVISLRESYFNGFSKPSVISSVSSNNNNHCLRDNNVIQGGNTQVKVANGTATNGNSSLSKYK